MSQNFDVFRLNVLPSPGIVDCDSLPNNQSKKICNSLELLSILCVNDVLHSLQNQRCDPAFVFPDLTHFFPQTDQFVLQIGCRGLLTADSGIYTGFIASRLLALKTKHI